MLRTKLYKPIPQSFKDADEKKGIIKGLFAHFDSLDKHGDIILKGSFKKTIKEHGPNGTNEIAHLLNHQGDQAVAVIQELKETNEGLEYVSKIGTHFNGRDFLEKVTSGIIKFHSIGYSSIKEEYDHQSKANLLREIKLYEGSSLEFIAANHNTPILELKDMDIEDLEECLVYMSKLKKFVRSSNATDETLQKLELELKSLQELFKPSPDTSTDNEADQINHVLKSLEKWKI